MLRDTDEDRGQPPTDHLTPQCPYPSNQEGYNKNRARGIWLGLTTCQLSRSGVLVEKQIVEMRRARLATLIGRKIGRLPESGGALDTQTAFWRVFGAASPQGVSMSRKLMVTSVAAAW
jgi:hypothetical protein